MTRFGYTLMTEQAGPRELVRHAAAAEAAGFDFEVISDHAFPWLDEQGHAPYAWSVLGAVSQVTEQVGLMTYVTCPTQRYHPAVVAQKAATVQLLSDGRFTLGLGSGENLNEHIVATGWPPANVRQKRLVEAIEIISDLFDGGYVNFDGDHYRVDSAKLWDLHETRVPLAVAVSGEDGIRRFAPISDDMISTEPDAELCRGWGASKGSATRKIGQVPISWDKDRRAAIERAHAQFRWAGLGWKVNAELPGTAGFAAATQFVRPEDVAETIPCGSDVDAVVAAVKPFWEAGYTDIALIQIGGDHQDPFLEVAERELLGALREAAPSS